MLHLEPDGLGERAGAGTNAGTCAGVVASDEVVSSVPVGATTELPGICFASGLWSFAESKGQDPLEQVDLTRDLPMDLDLER